MKVRTDRACEKISDTDAKEDLVLRLPSEMIAVFRLCAGDEDLHDWAEQALCQIAEASLDGVVENLRCVVGGEPDDPLVDLRKTREVETSADIPPTAHEVANHSSGPVDESLFQTGEGKFRLKTVHYHGGQRGRDVVRVVEMTNRQALEWVVKTHLPKPFVGAVLESL